MTSKATNSRVTLIILTPRREFFYVMDGLILLSAYRPKRDLSHTTILPDRGDKRWGRMGAALDMPWACQCLAAHHNLGWAQSDLLLPQGSHNTVWSLHSLRLPPSRLNNRSLLWNAGLEAPAARVLRERCSASEQQTLATLTKSTPCSSATEQYRSREKKGQCEPAHESNELCKRNRQIGWLIQTPARFFMWSNCWYLTSKSLKTSNSCELQTQ